MNISFKNIEIEGFQSIGSARIELSSQGIVLVKGINNYESNASSNGSGKSSIFEAIYWALYGRTTSGITDPVNRYVESGCYVKVDFSVDKKDYSVIRSIKSDKYKTGLILLREGTDISGRNKTDTEGMIKNDILRVEQDIFLSTIFLSQGFSGRISSLSPSGMKERIEVLTDTSELVDRFSGSICSVRDMYSSELENINRDKSYNEGIKSNLTRQIELLADKIQKSEQNKPTDSIEDLESEYKNLSEHLKSYEEKISELQKTISSINSMCIRFSTGIRNIDTEISSLNSKIESLTSGTTKICPTCGQPIDDNKHESLKKEYESRKSELLEERSTISNKYDTLSITLQENEENLSELDKERRDIISNIMNIKEKIGNVKSYNSNTTDRESLNKMKADILDTGKKISDLEKQASDKEMLVNVAKNCQGLVTKQFRGYLLQEIINFMNSRLEKYSTYLFSEDSEKIHLEVDSSKLNIYLGDVLYYTLSGGEKKKVDLALVLTQRDLSLNVAGFSCNLLILDEVLENLDNTATTCSLNLLMEASSDIESMFIISHNNYAIQSDSVITIEKGKDRISSVKIDVI